MNKSSDSVTDNFQKQLDELERIVSRMEQGELSLEKSINEFEQGMKLANQCQKTLQEAELRVKVLMSDLENGEQLEDYSAELNVDEPDTDDQER